MEFHVVEKLRPSTVHHRALTLRFTALVQAPASLYNCTRAVQENVEVWYYNLSIIELRIERD